MAAYSENHKYDAIFNLPHHVSIKHPRMSMLDRAAQFSPFSALTGHDAAVKESERLTDRRIELDEYVLETLNEKLQISMQHPDLPVKITYFQPDERKEGGCYVSVRGKIRKLDAYRQELWMEDGERIAIRDIIEIEHLTKSGK